jgi:leader peptidase (prepilin peptidase) / N-methyltransferase
VSGLVVVASAAAGLAAGWFVPLPAYKLSVAADEPARHTCASCDAPLPRGLVAAPRCPRCGVRWGAPAWLTSVLTGAACAVVALAVRDVVVLPLYLALCVLGVVLGVVDVACKRLPHSLVWPATWISLIAFTAVAALTLRWSDLLRAVLAAAVLGAIYLCLFLVARGGFGFGDVKLAILLGLFLGWLSWGAVLLGGLLPSLLNAPVLVGLLIARRISRHGSVPFGPAMLTGALVAIGISGWAGLIGRT